MLSTALKTDFPWYLDLSLSRSSRASWTPVEAPEGTAALNNPCSVTKSTYYSDDLKNVPRRKKNLLASLVHSHRAQLASLATYMNFALRAQCCVLHSA